MYTLITVLHVFVCFFLMLVVLLQAGKGGGMGMTFGSAGAQQVFGGRGAGGLLERITAGTAMVFILTSAALAHHASRTESTRLVEISDQKKKAREDQKAKQVAEDAAEAAKAKKELEQKGDKGTPPAPGVTPAPVAPLVPPAEQIKPQGDNGSDKAVTPTADSNKDKEPAKDTDKDTEKKRRPRPIPVDNSDSDKKAADKADPEKAAE